MKKFIFLLFLVLPLCLFAKFYDGKVIYKNGETANVQIEFPVKTTSKQLVIKIDDKKTVLNADDVSFFSVFLNNGNDTFVFKRGKDSKFDKEGNLITKKKAGLWTLLIKVYDDIIVSETAHKYDIKKEKNVDKLIAFFDKNGAGYYGYLLTKPDEDFVFYFMNINKSVLVKSIERSQKHLFSKCPNFSENIDYKKLEKGDFVMEIAKLYDECVKTRK
jgi:hypothetical protein